MNIVSESVKELSSSRWFLLDKEISLREGELFLGTLSAGWSSTISNVAPACLPTIDTPENVDVNNKIRNCYENASQPVVNLCCRSSSLAGGLYPLVEVTPVGFRRFEI